MKIELEKSELALIKQLLKKEYDDFKEDERDITRPDIMELAAEEKYEDFLEKLIKKI